MVCGPRSTHDKVPHGHRVFNSEQRGKTAVKEAARGRGSWRNRGFSREKIKIGFCFISFATLLLFSWYRAKERLISPQKEVPLSLRNCCCCRYQVPMSLKCFTKLMHIPSHLVKFFTTIVIAFSFPFFF